MENEALLFKKMQNGDWTAFNLFFKEYTEQLYLYVMAFVKERLVAEDIVQDAFIYLWTNRARIVFTGSVYSYLLQTVKNACFNYKTHLEVEKKYQNAMLQTVETESSETEWEELRQKVMEAIDSLPPKCREIFILGTLEGLKYQEIAERLDISVNTVKTQMKYAYRKVKTRAGTDSSLTIIAMVLNTFLFR